MKTISVSKILFIILVVTLAAARVFPAHAQATLAVTPAVIDASGIPNDIMNYELTVTNTGPSQENVFASVYELTPSGTQPFLDPAASSRPEFLADWIDVDRGAMMFAPGETKTIPVTVTVNPYAASGDYHAVIAFVTGGTRDEAEKELDGAPQALVNMAVASDLTASLKVDAFSADKGFYSGFPVSFTYIIENDGDASSTPSGEVMFYDRLGHEIGSVDANPSAIAITPGGKQTFGADWDHGGNLGQYKAVLDITYGGAGDRLQATALVWVLPWEKIGILFGLLFATMIVLAVFLHREYEKRHHRRRAAIERLLKRQKNDFTLDLRHPHE